MRGSLVLCGTLLIFSSASALAADYIKTAADGTFNLTESVLALSAKLANDLGGEEVSDSAVRKMLNQMASEAASKNIPVTPEVLSQVIYGDFAFEADEEDRADLNAENYIFHRFISSRRGVCMSFSMLYLMLGEYLSLDIKGVSVPDHFFIRFHSDRGAVNIETLRFGQALHSDDEYKKMHYVRDDENFYMDSLTRKQSFGVYLTHAAGVYIRQGLAENSIPLLKQAIAINPTDVEAMTNLGMAHEKMGNIPEAIKYYTQSVKMNRYDDIAHYRLSKLHADRGEYKNAILYFDECLRLGHPVDYQLLRRLEIHREDALYKEPRVPSR